MSDLIGKTLGKYQIVELIGRGGMAQVYRAFQPGLERYVAIKVLHTFLMKDPSFLMRFRREAQAIASLRHPHIIQVFDFDVENDIPYMVLELIEGITLSAVIDRRVEQKSLTSIDEILWLFRALCSAVGYAHHQGIVHRDLSPANILLTTDERIILTDFGIVRIIGGTVHTATGEVSGTPQYMSPEQSQGVSGDERSDLYALGIMLYELLTGHVPYSGNTPVSVLLKHLTHPIPVLRDAHPELPELLEKIIARALAKDATARYQTADELWRELHKLHPGELEFPKELFATAPLPSKGMLPAMPLVSAQRLKNRKAPSSSQRLPILVTVLVAFNVVALSYIAYRLSQNAPPSGGTQSRSSQPPESNPLAAALKQGTSQFQAAEFRSAAQAFDAALEQAPASLPALLGRAESFLALNDIEKGRADILSAVKLAPSDPLPRLALARFRLKYEPEHDWNSAKVMIDSAIQLAPNLAVGLFTRGWASLYYEPPASPVHVQHPLPCLPEIQAALSSGQASRAALDLQKAVDQNPNQITYQLTLADALFASDNLELAREHLSIVLQHAPGYFPALQRRAVLNAFIGDYSSAANDCTALLGTPEGQANRAEWFAWRAFTKYSNGKYPAALADVDASLALKPVNPAALYVRGLVNYQQGDYINALEVFQTVAERPAAEYECPFLNLRYANVIDVSIGQVYDFLEQHEKAIEAYNSGISVKPEWYLAYLYRAETYIKMRKFDEAEKDLKTAAGLPMDAEGRNYLQADLDNLAATRNTKQPKHRDSQEG